MSDAERLEQFRAVLLHVLNILRELRKDTAKLQSEVAALKVFLRSVDPSVAAELELIQNQGEKTLAAQTPPGGDESDKLFDEVIGLLELSQKKTN
jgi:uncharacterized protein YlxW (UPF0749 family)